MDGKFIISSFILPKFSSDHNPISLKFEVEEDLGPIPFRFSPLWITRDGFMELVVESWAQYVNGSPSFVREQKLKNTKHALKKWVKNSFNSPTTSRLENVIELSEIRLEMETSDITKPQLTFEHLAQIKTSLAFCQEEEYLHLKSRNL